MPKEFSKNSKNLRQNSRRITRILEKEPRIVILEPKNKPAPSNNAKLATKVTLEKNDGKQSDLNYKNTIPKHQK